MTRIAWHRPARLPVPKPPADRLAIAAPPQLPPGSGPAAWLTTVLPMLSSVSIAAYMITYRQTMLIFVAIGIVLISVGATVAVRQQTRAAAAKARDRQRDRYAEHLAEIRAAARAVAGMQRDAAVRQWPGPLRLWAVAEHRYRVWERRPGDPDFLHLRLGVGRAPLSTPLQLNFRADPTVEYDADLSAAARRIVEGAGTVGRQPAVADLAAAGVLSLVGPPERTRAAARALLCQLAVLHAPDDVLVLVSTGGADTAWQWAGWLPHTRDPKAPDSAAPALVASGFAGLEDVLERELARAVERKAARRGRFGGEPEPEAARHVVVFVDGFGPDSLWARAALARRLVEQAGPETGLSLVALVERTAHEPARVGVRALISADGSLTVEASGAGLAAPVDDAVADRCPPALAEATARALAPLLLSEPREETLAETVSLTALLGIGDAAGYEPRPGWVDPRAEAVLRASIGACADGTPLVLDLKESAQGGMGPHGLIVGATGSGKSELLRTLLTGLTARHSPDLLSMVLIDFKGGATFAGMTGLPHVAGLITNLADDLALVDRVRDALVGEQQRRQRLLRDAGNVDSLREYQARQAAGLPDAHGKPLEPLPYLLVIVDEFGELLSLRPDFINLFVQIGRVGRSLGMHLLLATQRLEEGRLRGLESHLSYRICLRTFSAAESRAVIGTTDAYRLPQLPGSAYLKVAESRYERFRVAHVSGPYQPDGPDEAGPAGEPVPLGLREAPEPAAETAGPTPGMGPVPGIGTANGGATAKADTGESAVPPRTTMQVVVEALSRHGRPVHQVWLPPLPSAVPLDALLGRPAVDAELGLHVPDWPERGRLRFPVGVVDLPRRQEQQPLVLDFSQTEPHLLLVGAPQSGKSTLLRTLMLSAMLTHTPQQLQFSCIDYGGGNLHALAGAPHVSGVAVRGEAQRTRRVLAEARQAVDDRERLFRGHGIGSAADLRRLREAGQLPPGTEAADVFVLVDNWGGLRADLPDLEPAMLDLAVRGPGAGVHLVLTANRWGDVRLNLRDAIGGRLELRLNDPAESEVSRPAARAVPPGLPGRGAAKPGLHYQAVLPRIDGRAEPAGLREAQDEAVAAIAQAWSGAPAAPIRLLPDLVRVGELLDSPPVADEAENSDGLGSGSGEPSAALIGVAERALQPVHLDLERGDQHLLVVGDSGSGKSTLLRTWMASLARQRPATAVRFLVVDYRRALLGAVPPPYLGGYAGGADAARQYVAAIAAKLAERLPPAELSPRELRERSWWQGPELYLVVDDYDLPAAAGPNSPLTPLAEYLPHGRDLGFHAVLARRSGGYARALTGDPLISRAHEAGAAALVLSADPREGVLFGGRRGEERPPGRALLVRRRREAELIQVLVDEEPSADVSDLVQSST